MPINLNFPASEYIRPTFVSENDPGATLGPDVFWWRPVSKVYKVRNSANTDWVDVTTAAVSKELTQNNFLVNGGQVTWESAYTFRVSAADYVIGGVQFHSAETTIVLDAAHASLSRFDVIVLNTSSVVAKVTGTAAAQPSEPDIDAGTQLKVALILVGPSSTQPNGVITTLVYAENVGNPTEWDWTSSNASLVLASTTTPRNGTKCIEGTNVVAAAFVSGQKGSGTINPNTYSYLTLNIRSKAAWNASRGLAVTLRNNNVIVGSAVNVTATGVFGFNSSLLGLYQQVAIPIYLFSVPSGSVINQVRITDFGGAIGFFIDDVSFQSGALSAPVTPSPVVTTITSGEFITSGLIAGYKFDQGSGQSVTDYGPNGYNGILGLDATAEGRDPTWVTPRGLLFDAVNDRAFAPTPNAAFRVTTALSFEISLKFAAGGGVLDKTGGDVTNKNYELIVGNPNTTFRLVKATVNQDLAIATADIIVGGFYHFVCTWDGNLMLVYKDGVKMTPQKVVTGPIDDVDGIFTIGALGGNVQPFGGVIYKVSVYNRALSHPEVRTLYESPGFNLG